MEETIKFLTEHNRSAFYLFDIGRLKKRVEYLKKNLPEEISLCYAVKANPFIIKEISDSVDRLEICSPGEACICDTLNIESDKEVISGVYKTPDFIERLVSNMNYNAVFTVESLTQYQLLCRLSKKYAHKLRVLLRLTNDSQFGINKSDIEEIIKNIKDHPYIELTGIQFFSGTQKTSLKKIKRELESLDRFILSLKEELGVEITELEYGPGFPASYFTTDNFDEDAYLQGFCLIISEMISKPKITLELGRSIASSCGKYFTHVVDVKQNKGQNYLLIDGGMHHITYFGQHMAMKMPYYSVVGKPEKAEDKSWTVCGSLCSMNDIVVKQALMPENIEIGDILCFENTGAYCMQEGISLFLSRDIPAVYLLHENGNISCVRRPYETAQLNTPKYERIF